MSSKSTQANVAKDIMFLHIKGNTGMECGSMIYRLECIEVRHVWPFFVLGNLRGKYSLVAVYFHFCPYDRNLFLTYFKLIHDADHLLK